MDNHMKKMLTGSIFVASLLLPGFALATPLYTNAVFGAGDKLVTFDEVPLIESAPVTNQFAAYGVTFGPGMREGENFGGAANFSGQHIASEGQQAPYSVFFTDTVDAAGAYWEFNSSTTTTIAAYLNGQLVESYLYLNTQCCQTAAFLGFQGIVFNEIRLTDLADGTSLVLDNLQFSTLAVEPNPEVPEPISAALVGIGAVGLAAARRRKAKRQPL
jgi:hypothetical protein